MRALLQMDPIRSAASTKNTSRLSGGSLQSTKSEPPPRTRTMSRDESFAYSRTSSSRPGPPTSMSGRRESLSSPCPLRDNYTAIIQALRSALDTDPGDETFNAMQYIACLFEHPERAGSPNPCELTNGSPPPPSLEVTLSGRTRQRVIRQRGAVVFVTSKRTPSCGLQQPFFSLDPERRQRPRPVPGLCDSGRSRRASRLAPEPG